MTIRENVSIGSYSTFGLGGPVRDFTEESFTEELRDALAWAKRKGIRYFTLVGGSNILFTEHGSDGFVFRFNFSDLVFKKNLVRVVASVHLPRLIDETLGHGL